MKKLLISIIIMIGVSINVSSQEKSNKELRGDKYSFRYSFSKAIKSYNATKHLTMEGQRHLAEAYHNIDSNAQAEVAYITLINATAVSEPMDFYNYAMILKINGKYQQAAVYMDKFKELKPNDLRAISYAENKSDITNLQKDGGKYLVKHLTGNSDADDFAPSYFKDNIVFASTRSSNLSAKKFNWTGKPFLDLYMSPVDSSQLQTPINFDSKINGKLHDGSASFSNDGTVMAFTRNNYNDHRKDKVVELQIWFSENINGKWSKPTPFILNNNEYSVGQPCLTKNGNTMYFTSDMPGGYGGADLYKVTKDEKGVWGKAQNLGSSINTEGDEMFPFVQETSKSLFFSSNGRFGLGGLDIFIAEMSGDNFSKVYNAGTPINTQYDDFSMIVNDKMTQGYLSSNRAGGSGGDDIYGVDVLQIFKNYKITGIAKNTIGLPIAKTFVSLFDDKGIVLDTVTTKDDAQYSFNVSKDEKFVLVGTNKDYVEGDTVANTLGKELIVTADIIMSKKAEFASTSATPNIRKKIKAGANLAEILGLDSNTIYFDFGKSNIRLDAAKDLNKIVKIMNEHPNMIVALSSYTDCRAGVEFNQRLSEQRAKSSELYIKKRITNPSRISGKGYGKTKLLNHCDCELGILSECSEIQQQLNRRTEFLIVKE